MSCEFKLEKDMSVDELKNFLGKLKKDLKQIKNGKMRTVFLNSILEVNSAYLNELEHSKNFKERFELEKNRAKEFLYNEEEQEKAGWNYTGGKKSVLAENIIKQAKWADNAYPSFEVNLWECELDIENCVKILKSL